MSPAPALRLTGTARFGDRPLFGPLTFEAPGGRWTCLLGASGAGKSTLLRLFAGIAAGVDFDGRAEASDGAPLQGRIALMAQDDLLAPWLSVRGNAVFGARLRAERPDMARAAAVLEAVGLSDHAEKRPHQLSGGQRQRAALARTLMEDRPVALLDEPFSALDAKTRRRMQELTAAALRGRTVLHVTHDPAEAAALGEHVAILTESGIETIAPPAAAIPRAQTAPETLDFAARLTRRLMETA